MRTGSQELVILSYATVHVCLHPCVSLNNEKICREISEHKIAVCEKTAGLRNGNFSDLNSACSKVLVPVEIFQFSDMHYETERYRDLTDVLCLVQGDFTPKEKVLSHMHIKNNPSLPGLNRLINRSEGSPTIWSCYANLNHYHYSFL